MYLIFCVITILIEIAVPAVINQNDDGIDGVLIKKTFIRNMQAANVLSVCPENNVGYICAEDCQTLLACNNGSTEPICSTKCAAVSPNYPYCTPGSTSCTNIANYSNTACIAAQIPTFTCTSIGYFPDPSDCALYHICTREMQETYQCPSRYVFDPTRIKCKLKNPFKKCSTIDCGHSTHHYVPYPRHKSYYAYCGHKEIIMFKCGDFKHFQFDSKLARCDFVCKSAGWFPNYKNCREYYECYKNRKNHGHGHKRFRSRIQTCPQNFIFDAERQHCIEGECLIDTTRTPTSETIVTGAPPIFIATSETITTDRTTKIPDCATLPTITTTSTTSPIIITTTDPETTATSPSTTSTTSEVTVNSTLPTTITETVSELTSTTAEITNPINTTETVSESTSTTSSVTVSTASPTIESESTSTVSASESTTNKPEITVSTITVTDTTSTASEVTVSTTTPTNTTEAEPLTTTPTNNTSEVTTSTVTVTDTTSTASEVTVNATTTTETEPVTTIDTSEITTTTTTVIDTTTTTTTQSVPLTIPTTSEDVTSSTTTIEDTSPTIITTTSTGAPPLRLQLQK